MNKRLENEISVSYSAMIKGIAVVLMVLHHGLGLPAEWFEEGLGFGQIVIGSHRLYELVGNPLKICVSLFAFLTGYSYYKKGQYTFQYSIKKSVKLLVKYWIVLFLIFYPAGYFISGHVPEMKELIFNLFSIHQRAVSFSWYVLFYVLCMCSLPFLVRLVTKNKWIDFLMLPAVCTAMLHILDKIVIQKWYLIADIRDYFYWLPIVWIGYLVAYYQLFEQITWKVNRWIYLMPMVLIPILRGLRSEIYGLNLDIIYAPIFIFSIKMLIKENSAVFKAFTFLGQYSMYIWFLHALFFWEKTRKVLQPIVYGSHNIVISMFFLLTLSLIMAILIERLTKVSCTEYL